MSFITEKCCHLVDGYTAAAAAYAASAGCPLAILSAVPDP